ncbi:MAG: TauD/TfdA family dioxygenase [Myxococcales bacterium]|nr:TauD/TfdA family dioxygenase [Myxococcales bacterium]
MANAASDGLEVHADWLRVALGGGEHADFHHRWLRHNCDRERHPRTGERTRCSSELPDDLSPRTARLTADALEITWPDGHASVYPLAWLRAHAYAVGRVDVAAPGADLAALELPRGLGLVEQVAGALERVKSRGAAVVREGHGDPEAAIELIIKEFAARGLAVVSTHFGRVEDLRTDNTTNQNTDQLGYTDAPIHLHTDQPFLERPPRLQLLQCVRPADEGGDNLLADARAVFRHLEAHDARAADLLASVPVRFHRRQARFERVVDAPIVARRGDDDFLVRGSYFTLAPHRLPFAAMTEFYRAHDKFFRLLRDPGHHVRVRLERGDWLIYDNHRSLHARTGFVGPRWLRGVYFDVDGGDASARLPA